MSKIELTPLVLNVAQEVGWSPAAVADALLEHSAPKTLKAAKGEGFYAWVRAGFVKSVKAILKDHAPGDGQQDFSSIDPSYMPMVSRLKSETYYVEELDDRVSIAQLIAEPRYLDDARKHMRRKGLETLSEADLLDQIYFARTATSDHANDPLAARGAAA